MRDEKTSSRALAQLQDRSDQLNSRVEQLSQDIVTQNEKKTEVFLLIRSDVTMLTCTQA